jgi:type I restriction enzyme, S subunit
MIKVQKSVTSSQLPKGYKQTEVGVIPEDWDVNTIGQSMNLLNGRAFRPIDWVEQGIPIIRIQNLNDSGAPFNYCRVDTKIEDKHRIEFGDIVFAWSGTKGTSFGARIWTGIPGVLNQHIFKVVPDKRKLVPHYAFLILLNVQEEIEKQAHGFKASFVHVKKSDLVGVNLPVPSIPEQDAIAHALSDIDALIESLDRLLTKKRQIKQGAMQELLRSEESWIEYLLSEICWFQEGPGVRNYQFTSSGVKLFNGTNIEKGRIDLEKTNRYISEKEAFGWYSHFLAEAGDIVIACSGISIEKFDEKVAVIEVTHLPLCMNTSTMRFKVKPEILDKSYLLHFLRSNVFKNQIGGTATGSAQLNFGPSHVSVVKIQIPDLSEQKAIATILSDMDAEIDSIEAKLTKTRQIKQGMMHELLTGRIRLI